MLSVICRMNKNYSCLLVGAWLCAPAVFAAETFVADPCFERLPFGCSVTNSFVLSGNQIKPIRQRLGVPFQKLSNTSLLVHGQHVQVNIFEAGTNAEAEQLHKAIAKMKKHPAFCLLAGRKVIEFTKAEVALAIKAAFELGFVQKPQRVTYRLTTQIALVQKADYMAFNELSRVFFAADPGNPKLETLDRVAALSKGFTFGESLVMRVPKGMDAASAYRFTPAPTRGEMQAHDRMRYYFSQPPKVLGVPGVLFKGEIACDHTGLTPTDRDSAPTLLSATPYWPVEDPEVVALTRNILAEKTTTEAKVQAILQWLKPGRNIKSDGPAGSRWGVKKVLAQKVGHCWDFSDCFVTLARAAGVPARQVGGWWFGTGGHIWAEVLVKGQGWQQVDPTGAGKLNCGIYHIPYFLTETGEMPILYLAMPQIEIIETK
jgi:transglutaminase-like putative cysteine protease